MKNTFLYTAAFLSVAILGCHAGDGQVGAADVQTYLEGRPLLVPEHVVGDQAVPVLPGDRVVNTNITGQPVTMTMRTIIMKSANVSALSLGKSTRLSDMAWTTPVTFLYKDGANTDAVEAVVEHNTSKGTVVFTGFQVIKVAKQ